MTSTMQRLSSWNMLHLLELLDYIDKKILKPDGLTMEELILEFEAFYYEHYENPEENWNKVRW